MIKILFIFILSLLLSACDMTEIEDNLYVMSMGYDYIEETDEIEITLYFLNTNSILKSDIAQGVDKNKVSTATYRGTNETEIIKVIEMSHNQTFQYSHLTSYILTTRYLEEYKLENIITSIKYNPRRYPNFYVFSTEETIKDIYSVKNIDDISSFYSLIFNPILFKEQHSDVDIIKITSIISTHHEDTLNTRLPQVRITEPIWEEDDTELISIELFGNCYLNKLLICKNIYENPGIKFIKNSNTLIQTFEVFDINIKDARFHLSFVNNNIVINYSGDFILLNNISNLPIIDIKEYSEKYINESINDLLYLDIDILNISDYLFRNKINDYNEIKISVDLNHI